MFKLDCVERSQEADRLASAVGRVMSQRAGAAAALPALRRTTGDALAPVSLAMIDALRLQNFFFT